MSALVRCSLPSLRAAAAASLSLVTAGCAVGPSFKPPVAPPSAGGAFVSQAPSAVSDAPPPDRWWELYSDPDVDHVVEEALAANTDLRAAIARLERAQAVLSEARAAFLPTTLLSGGARLRRGSINGPGATGLEGSAAVADVSVGSGSAAREIYAAGGDVAYEVDLFGRIRRQVEAARADAQAQAAAADYVRVSVAAETTRAFIGACASAAQITVARDGLKVADQALAIVRRQYRLGTQNGFDLERFGALREQAAAVIAPLENERRADLFNLALLTGRTPAQVDPAAEACTKAPALTRPLPAGNGATLLARRPDIREADRRLAAETARIGVATAALFPQVVFAGSVVAAGPSLGYATSTSRGLSFAVGPVVTWTFPNIEVARARIAQARASTREAYAAYQGTVLSALNETERALSAYITEASRNAELRAAMQRQQKALTIATAGARLGAVPPLDLLDTNRTLIQIQNDLASSDALLLARGITVFKTLGGGWHVTS